MEVGCRDRMEPGEAETETVGQELIAEVTAAWTGRRQQRGEEVGFWVCLKLEPEDLLIL